MRKQQMNDKKRTASSSRPARLKIAAAVAALSIALTPAAGWTAPGQAQAAASQIRVQPQSFKIDGLFSTIPAANVDGQMYVGLRALNEKLGLKTGWTQKSRTVTISGKNRTFVINALSGNGALNGQTVYGTGVILQDGAVYLPLRYLLEQMGFALAYDGATRTVVVQTIWNENALTIQTASISRSKPGQTLLIHYPQIAGYADAAVQQKINAFLKKEAEAQADTGSATLAKAAADNAEAEKAYPDSHIPPVSLEANYTITYNEAGKLSLFVDYYEYLGGAHGMTARVPYTFDLATGDVMTLKEAAGGDPNYLSVINASIRKQIAERKMMLFSPFEDIGADRPFFLKHDGIVVYFSPYEYTPYAEGMPEFVIPFTAFKKPAAAN